MPLSHRFPWRINVANLRRHISTIRVTIAATTKSRPQPNRLTRLLKPAIILDHCQDSNAATTITSIICRTGVDATIWKNWPTPDHPGCRPVFLLGLASSFTIAFFLAIYHPVSLNAPRLHLHHKRQNHGAAFSFLIIKFLQGIFNLGVDETPLNSADTTMVKGLG